MIQLNSRIWFPIGSSISTAIALAATPAFGMDPKSAWIPVIAGAVGAVVFWLFEWATGKLMHYDRFRARLDPKRSKFEGEWIEFYEIEDGRVNYAYFRIRYTGKEFEPYLIKGNAYDCEGHNYARWSSKMVKFDGNKGIIDYFYFGYFFEKDYSVRGMANLGFDDRTSYVNLPNTPVDDSDWKKSQLTTFNSGTGYFLDSSAAGAKQTKFHFIKVTDELLKSVFEGKEVNDVDAERCFVLNFHRRYGERLVKNGYLNVGDVC